MSWENKPAAPSKPRSNVVDLMSKRVSEDKVVAALVNVIKRQFPTRSRIEKTHGGSYSQNGRPDLFVDIDRTPKYSHGSHFRWEVKTQKGKLSALQQDYLHRDAVYMRGRGGVVWGMEGVRVLEYLLAEDVAIHALPVSREQRRPAYMEWELRLRDAYRVGVWDHLYAIARAIEAGAAGNKKWYPADLSAPDKVFYLPLVFLLAEICPPPDECGAEVTLAALHDREFDGDRRYASISFNNTDRIIHYGRKIDWPHESSLLAVRVDKVFDDVY